MSDGQIVNVFVYGTLKTGESRAQMWPAKPLGIERATTLGRLYDLGPYPGMTDGTDMVEGEVWHFDRTHMATTLRDLDEIEGFRDGPTDLYKRVVVECELDRGETVQAFTYLYAGAVDELQRVPPNAQGRCGWPACSSTENQQGG